MGSDYLEVRDALRDSHEHLRVVVDKLSPEQLREPSYCSDWTIAQCLSHLGSGAEIGLMLFQHALDGSAIPGREAFEPVWDKWNAKSPDEVGASVLPSDQAQVEAFEATPASTLEELEVPMMGRTLDAAGLIAMRLGEHVLHTWDVEVMEAPTSALPPRGVESLIDRSPQNAGRFARGERPAHKGQVRIATSAPAHTFVLDLSGEQVSLSPSPIDQSDIELPAESLIRLLYGRLDDAHTPASVLVRGPVSLDELRVLFPGF